MMRLFFLIISFFVVSFNFNLAAEEINKATETPQIEKIYSPDECYTVIKKLGEGAFGTVYAVENSKGEHFAIKSYKELFAEHILADAKREFQIGQSLDHPNIIRSIDMFKFKSSDNETTNLVLEFVDGKTLSKLKKGSYSNKQLFGAANQLINAIRYALTADLYHFDLHPGNVMVDINAQIKIIDLASFFTSHEMHMFFSAMEQPTTDAKQTNANNAPIVHAAMHQHAKLEPGRAERLARFFDQNPDLFKQLQQVYKKNLQQAPKKSIIKKAAVQANQLDQQILQPLQSHYFHIITEICLDLLLKSNLDRQTKIDLRVDIKTLEWNYQEDTNEGKQADLNSYLDQLSQLIQEKSGQY